MRTPQTLAVACQLLRNRVRFRRACLILPGHNLDDQEKDTLAIREAVRNYVEAWIVPLLDDIERGDMVALRKHIYSMARDEYDRLDSPFYKSGETRIRVESFSRNPVKEAVE